MATLSEKVRGLIEIIVEKIGILLITKRFS